MFGVVCSGRPIQLADQVEPAKFVVTIPNASNVSHIALFLLPQTEFTDPNFTGLVYIQLPNSAEFKLLGGINPLKPSAIYKLNNGAASQNNNAANGGQIEDMEMSIDSNVDATAGSPDAVINIGISIEPTAQAEALLLQEKQKQAGSSNALVPVASKSASTPKNPNDVATLANRIVTHAYNYLGSFIDSSGKVPMKAFDTWWDKFKTKLQNNPGFLDEL